MESVAKPTAERLEWWSMDRLKPYHNNTRTHPPAQKEALRQSFRTFGWVYPILVDPEGTIIAGHLRQEVAAEEGYREAKVLVAEGWSADQIQAYVIADNAIPELAGWNDKRLRVELRQLSEKGFSLNSLGLSEKSINKALGIRVAPASFRSFDETMETEHVCPRCSYRWSGAAGAADEEEEGGE